MPKYNENVTELISKLRDVVTEEYFLLKEAGVHIISITMKTQVRETLGGFT